MTDKKIEDVLFNDGEIHPPRVKGTIEAWIEHKKDHNWKEEQGTIAVDVGRGVKVDARGSWLSFINNRVEGSLHEKFGGGSESDELADIFREYWDSNEELREDFKEISYYCHDASMLINCKAAEEQGGIEHLMEEYGKQPIANAAYDGRQYVEPKDRQTGDADDEEHEDQTSFGASKFPELHEIGVVDDNANVVNSKVRGLAKAFLKDVDEILGEDRELEVRWVQKAFLEWGNDRWPDEWIGFAVLCTGSNEIYDAISWLSENDEASRTTMEKKYTGNRELEMGNRDTDDATKSFLDAEVPGWDEEDGEDEEEGSKSKWEEYEERSEELDAGKEKEQENGEDREGESKWERFEKQSEEADTAHAKPDDTDGQGKDSDRDSDGSAGGSDTNGSPNDLGDWAESEGVADKEDFKDTNDRGDSSDSRSGVSKTENRSKTSSSTETTNTGVECEDGGRPHEIQWPNVEPIDEFERNRIYEGNTFEWAMKLPDNSIDTLVTSPPYYALRDYDIDDAFPISGDFTCEHKWQDEFCTKCGSFLGQLGHEPDPATFVEHIVDLMDRYKRVLKPSGSLWLNIGDTYAGKDIDGRVKAKNKSRMMIPERVYRRMVQTGWHLRDYVIWVKKVWMPDDDLRGNGKPFASSSRLADQWEPMVRFSPTPDPYSDVDSNRLLPPSFDGDLGSEGIEGKFRKGEDTQRGKTYNELGTNPPDVWLINSDGYDGDHRAVFPEELPKRCINITTPDKVCGDCGRPYDKEVHVEDGNILSPGGDYATYEPRCHCDADDKPGVGFDPFLGSGTTAVAAANNGYDWAGVELSDKYAKLARKRIPDGRQVGLGQW